MSNIPVQTSTLPSAPPLPTRGDRIPGCGALFSNLNAINAKIQFTNQTISELKEKLKSILSKENMPKKQLYEQIDILKEQIDIKTEERNSLNEMHRDLIKLKDIQKEELFKEKKGNNEVSIKTELKKLEAQIIMHKMTKKEESVIVDKQTALKKQLKTFSNLKNKEEQYAKLGVEILEKKKLANEKHEELIGLKTTMNSLYSELKSLNPQKSSLLLETERNIKKEEIKIKEFIKQRNEIRKDITVKQKEYEEKKEFYLKRQIKKDEISEKEKILKSLIEKKKRINNELSGKKLLKAKTLLSELKRIDFNLPVSMNLNLFEMFNEFNLDIKKKEENIKTMELLIKDMEESIDSLKEELFKNILDLSKEIKRVEEEIKDKQKEIKEMETAEEE